jgi:hypothetical protein
MAPACGAIFFFSAKELRVRHRFDEERLATPPTVISQSKAKYTGSCFTHQHELIGPDRNLALGCRLSVQNPTD